MANDNSGEHSLFGDLYESVAFRGTSAQHVAEVIQEVDALSRLGAIYPPAFATVREPVLAHGLTSHPVFPGDGRLSPAEAVALKIVADEGSAMAQTIGENSIYTPDVVEGIADFGNGVSAALRIREKILNPDEQHYDVSLLKLYDLPIRADKEMIEDHTVRAIVQTVGNNVERHVRANPRGQISEQGLQARILDRYKGIALGEKMYLQVLGVAIQKGLPTTLGPK